MICSSFRPETLAFLCAFSTLVTKLPLRNALGAMLRFAGGCVPGPEQVERLAK
jgi:hypothetical protein